MNMNNDHTIPENDTATSEALAMSSTMSSSGVFLREIPDAADEELCRQAVEASRDAPDLPSDLEERLYRIAQTERMRLGYATRRECDSAAVLQARPPAALQRGPSAHVEPLRDAVSPARPKRSGW